MSIVFAILTVIHAYLVVALWPQSLVSIPARSSELGYETLLHLVLGCVCGSVAYLIGSMVRTRNVRRAAWSLSIVVLGVAAYLALPLSKVFVPSNWIVVIVGALGGMCIWRARMSQTGTEHAPKQLSFIVVFCLIFNLLLIIAPSSVIFPTGFAGDVKWAIDTLILRHEDSVSVHNNLLFIILRAILDPVVGGSLAVNSFVSLTFVALGLSLLVIGIQIAAGSAVAVLALFLMVSEGWVLVTSYSANLVASLLTTCGVLFYVLMRVGFDTAPRTRRWHWITWAILVGATLLAFYSYAAVRMPFVFSIACIACLYLAQTNGSFTVRSVKTVLWVVSPVVAGVAIMTICAYKGNLSGLQRDLLVSWPKDAVLPHPSLEEMRTYVLVRNFDTPLWKEIARPADGSNKSVIWTRTPSETLQAFAHHLTEIARNIPRFFFIQPLPFFLCLLGLSTVPLMSRKQRLVYGVCLVWSVVWISTYLLVPDASAFRRAVAFPGAFALVLALAFSVLCNSRKGRWIALSLVAMITLIRLPYELAFANLSEARMRMFTLCATAPAHRALLTSALVKEIAPRGVFVLPNGINGGKEGWCFNDAVRSHEWRRVLPHTKVVDVSTEPGLSELAQAPSGSSLIAYCNFESQRTPYVASLCKGEAPGFAVVGEVPNSFDGAHWVVLTAAGSR